MISEGTPLKYTSFLHTHNSSDSLPVEEVTRAADEVAMVVVGGARGRRLGLGEASLELGLSFILAKSAVLCFSCGAGLSAEQPGSGR